VIFVGTASGLTASGLTAFAAEPTGAVVAVVAGEVVVVGGDGALAVVGTLEPRGTEVTGEVADGVAVTGDVGDDTAAVESTVTAD
jgi:hypothetical protein